MTVYVHSLFIFRPEKRIGKRKEEEIYCPFIIAYYYLQTDPFNRSHLTPDMLIPDNDLKARIEEFIRSQELKKHGEGLSIPSTKATLQTTTGEMNLIG